MLRFATRMFAAIGILTFASFGLASADVVTGFRFTYGVPGGQDLTVLGPGAARGIKFVINDVDAPQARGARPEGGESFAILGLTLLAQGAPGCGTPKLDSKGNEGECTWEKDCALPFDFVELCIRTNFPIYSIEAYFVDGFGEFLAPALVTPLNGACQTLDCGGAAAVTESIWPPNHKLAPVEITGVTGVGEVSIVVTGVTQDEVVNERGDGNTCPDAAIDLDGRAWVRMERSGLGNGRVYVVSFTATDETGASCDGQVAVCVPHDPQSVCVDDGQTANSLEPCDNGNRNRSLEAIASQPSLRVVSSTSSRAEVEFALPSAGHVDVGVFDVAGRRVASIENGERAAGLHRVSWNARGIAQGVYFVRMNAAGATVSRTVMIAD